MDASSQPSDLAEFDSDTISADEPLSCVLWNTTSYTVLQHAANPSSIPYRSYLLSAIYAVNSLQKCLIPVRPSSKALISCLKDRTKVCDTLNGQFQMTDPPGSWLTDLQVKEYSGWLCHEDQTVFGGQAITITQPDVSGNLSANKDRVIFGQPRILN